MKYTFIFRSCDIVPEISRQTNDWTDCAITAAINEILLIDPRLDVKWTIQEEQEDESAMYVIIAETEVDEMMIQQKYTNYRVSRGLE